MADRLTIWQCPVHGLRSHYGVCSKCGRRTPVVEVVPVEVADREKREAVQRVRAEPCNQCGRAQDEYERLADALERVKEDVININGDGSLVDCVVGTVDGALASYHEQGSGL